MLSINERKGLSVMLDKLQEEDLKSLVNTVSNGLIKANGKQDAIIDLLRYADKPSAIMRRRKVKKEFIFQYLREANIYVSPNGDKLEFIKACLSYWGSLESSNDLNDVIMEDESHLPAKADSTSDLQYQLCNPSQSQYYYEEKSECDTQSYSSQSVMAPYDSFLTATNKESLQIMGNEFVVWFYNLLNNVSDTDVFGPQHFWSDVLLRLNVTNSAKDCDSKSFSVAGSVNVTDFIRMMYVNKRYYFHPNLSNPLQTMPTSCTMNRHGLIRITASGVIHQDTNCVGVFDHVFGLVQDPTNHPNSWKIKHLEMYLSLNTTESFEISNSLNSFHNSHAVCN